MMTNERRTESTEPPSIRPHLSWLEWNHLALSLLKCRHLDDFPVSVVHDLAAGQHLESLDLFGIAVRIPFFLS